MIKENILIIMTSHDQLGDSDKKTGFHYEEMTTPYQIFRHNGYEVTLASIKGGQPPYDPGSLKQPVEENPESVIEFLKNEDSLSQLENTLALDEIKPEHYSAVYFPGGHGTMWDLPNNSKLGTLVTEFYQSGKPVAAVCHGIAALLAVKTKDGSPLVARKRINSFTDSEERAVDLDQVVPFLLESKLRELGANFECAENFEEHVAIDGNIITGQNPASAAAVAESIVEFLAGDKRKRA